MKINILHSIKILLTVFTIVSCGKSESNNQNTSTEKNNEEGLHKDDAHEEYFITKEQFESSGFTIGKLEEKPFYQIVRANGVIDLPPQQHVSIPIYFDGFIKTINFLEGQEVKKNQTLFTLEHPDYILQQKNYLAIKEDLTYLKAEYERHNKLAKKQISSQKQFLKAQKEYNIAVIKLKAAENTLAMMNLNPSTITVDNLKSIIVIKSPLSGIVTKVNIHTGMFVSQSSNALEIINTAHLHLELNIFEKDLAFVRKHQDIRFWVQNDAKNKYEAEIYLINKVVDKETRTVNIHAHLEDEENISKFHIGMYVTAEIIIDSKNKLSFPEDAIVEIENEYFVLVKKSKNSGYPVTFDKIKVTLGMNTNGYVEVLNSDFFNDKTILTKGSFNIIKGNESGHSH